MPPVPSTVLYLQSYMQSLDLARRFSTDEIMKGKMPMVQEERVVVKAVAQPLPWPPPPPGQVSLSVDESFSQADGSAAAGMILRRPDGSVIFAAY